MGKVREDPRKCQKKKLGSINYQLLGGEDVEVGNAGEGENRRADSGQGSKGSQWGLASNLCWPSIKRTQAQETLLHSAHKEIANKMHHLVEIQK